MELVALAAGGYMAWEACRAGAHYGLERIYRGNGARVRRRAATYTREGDARLEALLALCATAGASPAFVNEAKGRMERGRVGRVLAHVVEEVKAERTASFVNDESEFLSAMRKVAETMKNMGMRPAHIAEWKYLVTVAVLTPTEDELIAMSARESQTRATQIAVADAIKRGPTLLDYVTGNCSWSEYSHGCYIRKDGQMSRLVGEAPHMPIPRLPVFAEASVPTAR